MDIENCIEEIVNNGRIEDMEELSDMLEDTMEIVKDYDKNRYKKYEMRLYKLAFGSVLNKEMAEEIVLNMRPYGQRWRYEEIRELQEQYNIDDIRTTDFFVVINSAYNDYKDILGEDIDKYIKFTIDFIKDEDSREDKVFTYFTTIPKND